MPIRGNQKLIQGFGDLPGEIRVGIDAVIARKRQERIEELTEKRKNPAFVMRDDPKAVLSRWLQPASGFLERNQEPVRLWQDGALKEFVLTKDESTYETSWLTWTAFNPVYDSLSKKGLDQDTIYRIVVDRFPFVYGVATILRRRIKQGPYIFCGIRSQNLAGVNTGMVSFPAGLVNPGEALGIANIREVFEEWSEEKIRVRNGLALGLHDNAPSCTFVSLAEVRSGKVRDCFEWRGGKGLWIPEFMLLEALEGFDHSLVGTFRANGINVPDTLQIATDVREPMRELLIRAYPSR